MMHRAIPSMNSSSSSLLLGDMIIAVCGEYEECEEGMTFSYCLLSCVLFHRHRCGMARTYVLMSR